MHLLWAERAQQIEMRGKKGVARLTQTLIFVKNSRFGREKDVRVGGSLLSAFRALKR